MHVYAFYPCTCTDFSLRHYCSYDKRFQSLNVLCTRTSGTSHIVYEPSDLDDGDSHGNGLVLELQLIDGEDETQRIEHRASPLQDGWIAVGQTGSSDFLHVACKAHKPDAF